MHGGLHNDWQLYLCKVKKLHQQCLAESLGF